MFMAGWSSSCFDGYLFLLVPIQNKKGIDQFNQCLASDMLDILPFLHPKKVKVDLGVSKNKGTPKWMVWKMENPIKMDDLGGTIIFGNIHFKSLLHTAIGYLNHFPTCYSATAPGTLCTALWWFFGATQRDMSTVVAFMVTWQRF